MYAKLLHNVVFSTFNNAKNTFLLESIFQVQNFGLNKMLKHSIMNDRLKSNNGHYVAMPVLHRKSTFSFVFLCVRFCTSLQ